METKFVQLDLFALEESAVSVFKIFPNDANYGNLRTWIELSGGVVLNCDEDDPYAIPIVDFDWYVNVTKTDLPSTFPSDHFLPSFIYDCYEHERVFDLNVYKMGKSQYVTYDANAILQRVLPWSALQEVQCLPGRQRSPTESSIEIELLKPELEIQQEGAKRPEIARNSIAHNILTALKSVNLENPDSLKASQSDPNFTVKNGTFSFKVVNNGLLNEFENMELNKPGDLVPANVGISVDIQDDEELILRNNVGTDSSTSDDEYAAQPQQSKTEVNTGMDFELGNKDSSPVPVMLKPLQNPSIENIPIVPKPKKKLCFKMGKPALPYKLPEKYKKAKRQLNSSKSAQLQFRGTDDGSGSNSEDKIENHDFDSRENVDHEEDNGKKQNPAGIKNYPRVVLHKEPTSTTPTKNLNLEDTPGGKKNRVRKIHNSVGFDTGGESDVTKIFEAQTHKPKKDKHKKTKNPGFILLTPSDEQIQVYTSAAPTLVNGNKDVDTPKTGSASEISAREHLSGQNNSSILLPNLHHLDQDSDPKSNEEHPALEQLSKRKRKRKKQKRNKPTELENILQEEREEVVEETVKEFSAKIPPTPIAPVSVPPVKPKLKSKTIVINLPETLPCDLCDYLAVSNQELVSHLREHKGRQRLQCSHCDYSARKQSSFDRHQLVHTATEINNRNNGSRSHNSSQNDNDNTIASFEDNKPHKKKKKKRKSIVATSDSELTENAIESKSSHNHDIISQRHTITTQKARKERIEKTESSNKSLFFPVRNNYKCLQGSCKFTSETAYELRIHSRCHI